MKMDRFQFNHNEMEEKKITKFFMSRLYYKYKCTTDYAKIITSLAENIW